MIVTPNNITTHPGARVVFSVDRAISTLPDAEVLVYFPGRSPENATIHETDNTFSYVIPPRPGDHEVSIVLTHAPSQSEKTQIQINVNPAQATALNISSSVDTVGSVFADFYDPVGSLVASEDMSEESGNLKVVKRPEADWLEGLYNVYIRDDEALKDVLQVNVRRPEFASMQTFYSLSNWQRQIVEYLKFEMMGDTDYTHPGALFTLEQYAKHWINTVGEINDIPPVTYYKNKGVPIWWSNVLMKGTLLRIFHALANRSVMVPRFRGLNFGQTEDHLQQSWETRYRTLRPEYEEERDSMKVNRHLPDPAITVDPSLGWLTAGSITGMSGLRLIGRPSWSSRFLGR